MKNRKSGQEKLQTLFSLLQPYGDFFLKSRTHNSEMSCLIWLKFEFVQDFMPVLITCKFEEDPIKNGPEKSETPFSPL